MQPAGMKPSWFREERWRRETALKLSKKKTIMMLRQSALMSSERGAHIVCATRFRVNLKIINII